MTELIPRIETERLVLRGTRLSDFDGYRALLDDPRAKVLFPSVTDTRSLWRMVCSLTGMWTLTGSGWWTIELRETGALAGMVGAFFRETLFPLTPESQLELGWTIVPAYWRRGLASEAAAAALASGFSRTTAPRAIAQMDPANTGSIGVAKAIGMTHVGETSYYGVPSVLYAMTREAYCATANKKST